MNNFENSSNTPAEIKKEYDELSDDLKKIFDEFLDPDWEHTPEQAMEEVRAMQEINNLTDNYKEIALDYLRKPHPAYSPKRALEEINALKELATLSEDLQNKATNLMMNSDLMFKPTEALKKIMEEIEKK